MARPLWAEPFEAYAQRLIDLYDIPGLALGVAREGEPVYLHGFGHRNREQGLPMGVDTVCGIASCTKSFTGVAIMQLQEAGLLSVHDPLVKFVPEFRTPDPEQTGRITLHHLLTHTAGLPPLPTLRHAMAPSMRGDNSLPPEAQAKIAEITPIETFEQLVEFLNTTEYQLLGAPGVHFSYSNDSYGLLGLVIERVTGKAYEAYVEEKILVPAGMTRSSFDVPSAERWGDVATLYAGKQKEGGAPGDLEIFASPSWQQTGPMTAGGGLRSTVRDMLRYAEIYRTGGKVGETRILSADSVAAMTRPYAQVSGNTYYGYGLMVIPGYQGVTLVEHGGSLKGVASLFTIVPERGLTGAVLTNLGGVPSAQILLGALNAEMSVPMETARTTLGTHVCTEAELAQYSGEYTSGEGVTISVSVKEGGLQVAMKGFTTADLFFVPAGVHLFKGKVKETEMTLRFMPDETGAIWAVANGLRILRKTA